MYSNEQNAMRDRAQISRVSRLAYAAAGVAKVNSLLTRDLVSRSSQREAFHILSCETSYRR